MKLEHKMRMLRCAAFALLVSSAICLAADETAKQPESKPLPARDAEIIRFCLGQHDAPSDRIYFLTTTPLSDWGEAGSWAELPAGFHVSIANLKRKFLPASGAFLDKGRVLRKSDKAESWMRWVHVRKWISETEVEVEDGVWCCPLGGGASIDIYEKKDGRWEYKDNVSSWVS